MRVFIAKNEGTKKFVWYFKEIVNNHVRSNEGSLFTVYSSL